MVLGLGRFLGLGSGSESSPTNSTVSESETFIDYFFFGSGKPISHVKDSVASSVRMKVLNLSEMKY